MQHNKPILDACCGSRMFWFDKNNPAAVFGDKRTEDHILCDGRTLNITPDIEMDFTAIPFADESFRVVVFDPPHIENLGKNSWMAKKYGVLGGGWKEELRQGFSECMRVLKPYGVLVFKWNETRIPVSKLLDIFGQSPVIGHRSGRQNKTHWMLFMKQDLPTKGS